MLFIVLATVAFSSVNNTEPISDPASSSIIYAFDMEQIIDDSIYPKLVASGGTCTADCSGCWTNECTTSANTYCGSIQGTDSKVIVRCYRSGS